jgi:hypothetical protein
MIEIGYDLLGIYIFLNFFIAFIYIVAVLFGYKQKTQKEKEEEWFRSMTRGY